MYVLCKELLVMPLAVWCLFSRNLDLSASSHASGSNMMSSLSTAAGPALDSDRSGFSLEVLAKDLRLYRLGINKKGTAMTSRQMYPTIRRIETIMT